MYFPITHKIIYESTKVENRIKLMVFNRFIFKKNFMFIGQYIGVYCEDGCTICILENKNKGKKYCKFSRKVAHSSGDVTVIR